MRVLLLGANGQLGTDLKRAVADWPDVELIPWTRAELDVEDLEGIRATLEAARFDALINCTSYHKTDDVEDNGTKAIAVNAHAVREMAGACESIGARFVHISTDYVFPGTADQPYTERDCPAPVNVYGLSKYMGETLALQAHPDTLILRVASLFGVAGASGKGGNFVETMLRIAREKGEVRVVDDVRMSPTSTLFVARTILKLLEMQAGAGTYHCVNSEPATWHEFAREIIRCADVPADVVPIPSTEFPARAARPPYSVLSNAKLRATIGPVPTWRESLREYLKERRRPASGSPSEH